MIELVRLCLIVSAKCNRHCTYCIQRGVRWKDPQTDPAVLEYLQSLPKDGVTKVIVLSGGEPLTEPQRVKDIVEILPEHLHIKLCTNGSKLTSDIVDFVNDRGMELHLSHDGPNVSQSMRRDIFQDSSILRLVRRVKNLTIAYVINSRTLTDEGYVPWFDRILERDDWNPLGLIDPTDETMLAECIRKKRYFTPHPRRNNFTWYSYPREKRKYPIILTLRLNGTLYDMSQKNCLGNLWQTQEELNHKLEYNDNSVIDYCRKNSSCIVRSQCMRILHSGKLFCDYQNMPAYQQTSFIAI